MMMNCREATRLMSEAQDRKLTLKENAELKFHKMICTGCRNFGNQMDSIRAFMQEFAKTPEGPGQDGSPHSPEPRDDNQKDT